MKLRTCLSCGWVHVGVCREAAEEEVRRFNAYYEKADETTKALFGGPSSIDNYECCFRCGGTWENFRDAIEGDCPAGCTMQTIIVEEG